jgi:hypothetical protein
MEEEEQKEQKDKEEEEQKAIYSMKEVGRGCTFHALDGDGDIDCNRSHCG